MAWKEVTVEELAKSLGANVAEVREKQRLAKLIVKTRKDKDLSQAVLAKKLGISQARVAQIESGVGTAKVTFDVLFNMLVALGLDYKVVTRKAALGFYVTADKFVRVGVVSGMTARKLRMSSRKTL